MKKELLSPRQRFEQSLHELARFKSLWTVFNDFLDFSLLMIRWWDLKATDFIELEKKYPDKWQHELFAAAYVAMSEIADNDGAGFKDPFGDYYMEFLGNERAGQFFTPEHICDMIAQMQTGDRIPDNSTIADPCCGSGRLLLSAAKLNRNALFFAADVDLVCCKMTVLNFFLNSMYGEIAWMNTLSDEHWKSWHIKKVMNDKGFYLPYYIETNIDQTKSAVLKHDDPATTPLTDTIKPAVKSKILEKWKNEQTAQLTLNFE